MSGPQEKIWHTIWGPYSHDWEKTKLCPWCGAKIGHVSGALHDCLEQRQARREMMAGPQIQFCTVCNKSRPYGTCCTLKDCPWVATTFPGHDPLLQEREKTHGSFARNAEISQVLKFEFEHFGSKTLIAVHQEALDMIALKLSRILSGQANFKDHWRDISGYSLLAMEACDADK